MTATTGKADDTRPPDRRGWPDLLRFSLLFTALSLLDQYLVRQPGSLAYLNFAAPLAIAALLGDARKPLPYLLICTVCGLLPRLLDLGETGTLTQSHLLDSSLTALIDSLQIWLAVWLAKRILANGNKPAMMIEQSPLDFLRFMLAVCVLPPLFGASAHALLLQVLNNDQEQAWQFAIRAWAGWYAGAAVGTLSLLPLAIQLYQNTWRSIVQQIDPARALALAGLNLTISTLAFLYLPFPFIYAMATLIIAAMLVSLAEMSALTWLITLVASMMLANGSFAAPPMTSYWQILLVFLPLFLTQFPPLILVVSMQQTRAREQARAQSEQARQESAEQMQAILRHAADAIITTDQAGRIESFNRAAEQIYGCSEAFALGRDWQQLSGCQYGTQELAQRPLACIEIEHRRQDGSVFPAELLLSQFHVGAQTKYVTIVRDLTEKHRVERLKSDFVSTVSHELRTPLTSIRGALGLMQGGITGPVPEAMAKMLLIAISNANRLTRLINDLLDMQKMEAGMMRFDNALHALAPLLQATYDANTSYAQQMQVELQLAQPIPQVQVWLDAVRLEQILGNLISNACKFSPANSKVVLSAAMLGSDQVRIQVTDQGCGISSEFAPHIFQKFSQSDTSDTKRQGGTGLGLTIARSISEQMGGRLDYHSSAGQGSTFFLDLPIHQAG